MKGTQKYQSDKMCHCTNFSSFDYPKKTKGILDVQFKTLFNTTTFFECIKYNNLKTEGLERDSAVKGGTHNQKYKIRNLNRLPKLNVHDQCVL